jgi:photosystem II stability/assembly factor-like uncharacterized protein
MGGSWIAAGLTGGDVRALAMDESTATLYAAASGSVYKSRDGGGTWTGIAGLTSTFVQTLALDPSTPATIYAGGTDRSGEGVRAFKSTDGGDTWTPSHDGLSGSWVWRFVIDRASPTTLYAGTFSGVFKSTNAGQTWTAVSAGLTDTFVQTLAIDPSRTGTLYAGTFAGGVFKSTDGGEAWKSTNRGMSSSVSSLAVDASSPHTIYAGTNSYGGVFKSTNEGESWTTVKPALDLYIEALVIHPTAPATLYAGTASYDYPGFLKSTDGGATWRQRLDARVFALVMDPSEPDTLYAGTLFPSGVYKSTDGGESWSSVSAGIYLGADAGVGALAVDRSAPATLYAGVFGHSGDGLFKSTDAGQSWTAVNSGLTVKDIRAVAIDPSTPHTVYAATFGGGIFKSTDGGESWTASNAGLTDLRMLAMAIDPRNPSTVYAGTNGGGIFQSTNAGGTWSALNGGLGNLFVNALAIDPSTSRLYAGTDGGVYDYLAASSPCVSDSASLCLGGGRFRLTTEWSTAAGQSGSGRAVTLAGGDTGYFTFFGDDNVEVAVKVLNGCSVNGNYWIFAGGMTDVSVVLTVSDTQTGTVQSYTNPQGTPFRPIQDTTTFATCSAGTAVGARPYGSEGSWLAPTVTESLEAPAAGPCVANATTLCLSGSRYEVRVRWITPDGNSGAGQVIPLTAETGGFSFFSPSNLEVLIKVLDGCAVNSRYWTFAGGLTDVNVILTVTDTQTGVVRSYTNPQGMPFEPIQDTNAFEPCSGSGRNLVLQPPSPA